MLSERETGAERTSRGFTNEWSEVGGTNLQTYSCGGAAEQATKRLKQHTSCTSVGYLIEEHWKKKDWSLKFNFRLRDSLMNSSRLH